MLGTIFVAIAATYLLASLLALAPRKSGYSHLKHTISEIGESGAPNQRLVAFGVFLPVGLILLLVAYLVRPSSTAAAAAAAAAALALSIAIGYLGAAAFPCDQGSPMSGTPRQALHDLAGAAEYFGGGFALMVLAESLDRPFRLAGAVAHLRSGHRPQRRLWAVADPTASPN